ncbi:MAG: sensor histidine kinase [Longimicrobiales bacterium]
MLTIALGTIVIFGWLIDSRVIKSILPGFIAMNPVTAASFVLSGIALRLACRPDGPTRHRQAIRAVAAGVAAIAATVVIGYLTPLDLRLDRLLFAAQLQREVIPNRIAPNTAAAFLLVAGALWLLPVRGRRSAVIADVLGLAAALVGIMGVVGYLYALTDLTNLAELVPIAAHTAAGFALLGTGVLGARPDSGLTRPLAFATAGSRMSRRMLASAIAIPLLLTPIATWVGRTGGYRTGSVVSLSVALAIVLVAGTIWWAGHEMNLAEAKRRRAEQRVRRLNRLLRRQTAQLEVANRELESFSYSVSHDLRAPLRTVTSFSQALLEDQADRLDEAGKDYLARVARAGERMALLIDDMLALARVARQQMNRQPVDLSALADDVIVNLRQAEPGRTVDVSIARDLRAEGDPRLIRLALENLIGNAWKYSARANPALIEIGMMNGDVAGRRTFFVRDNGAGFDMQYADRLFTPFQRLHSDAEFAGSGVGLATVSRIVSRHGGAVRAEGEPGRGATFYFTLPVTEERTPHE